MTAEEIIAAAEKIPVVTVDRFSLEALTARLRPARRSTYLRPTRLSAAVYGRHDKAGGVPLHDYGSDGRCRVRGCDIYDPTENDDAMGGE